MAAARKQIIGDLCGTLHVAVWGLGQRCQSLTNLAGDQSIIFGAATIGHIGSDRKPVGKGLGQFDIGTDAGKQPPLSELTGDPICHASRGLTCSAHCHGYTIRLRLLSLVA